MKRSKRKKIWFSSISPLESQWQEKNWWWLALCAPLIFSFLLFFFLSFWLLPNHLLFLLFLSPLFFPSLLLLLPFYVLFFFLSFSFLFPLCSAIWSPSGPFWSWLPMRELPESDVISTGGVSSVPFYSFSSNKADFLPPPPLRISKFVFLFLFFFIALLRSCFLNLSWFSPSLSGFVSGSGLFGSLSLWLSRLWLPWSQSELVQVHSIALNQPSLHLLLFAIFGQKML